MIESYKMAVQAAMQKEPEYFTGGFDIMKKLQQKLTGKPQSDEAQTGGFDIMKNVFKNPVPVKK
jgi:hypothetical protein